MWLDDDRALSVELKFANKPRFEQPAGAPRVQVPMQQWFHLVVHYVLEPNQSGLVELFQDGVQLVSLHGWTLPLANTILNRFLVGITADNWTGGDTVLYVDDARAATTRE